MEVIILACMTICVVVLFRTNSGFSSVLLWVLSANIITSFAVLMICKGSAAAVVLFAANLLVSPWVAFLRAKGKALSGEKDKGLDEWRP